MKGPVISIKDLLAECVRKAYIIICLGIVCAVALCAFKFVKDTNYQNAMQLNQGEDIVAEIELSEEQEFQIQNYINAVNERDGVKEYLRDSIYINCNPYDTDYVHIQYQVESSSKEQRRDAILALRTYILGGGVASYFSEQTDGIATKYFTELIRCESMTNTSYLDNGIIEIIMYAGSEADAKLYGAWMQECLDAYTKTLNRIGIKCTLEKISEKTLSYTLTKIVSDRDNAQARYEEYQNNVKALEGALSVEQLKIANQLLGEEIEDVSGNEHTSPQPQKVSLSIKYFVLGAILGIGGAIALIMANYVLSDTLKTPQMIKEIYGVRHLGKVSIKPQNLFKGLAAKIFYHEKKVSQEEEIQLLVSKIQVLCENENIQKVALVGDSTIQADQVLDNVVQNLKKNGIECTILNEICRDFVGFREVNKIKNVILMEMLRKTKYSSIDEVVSLCKENEITMLGYFVFEA